MSFELAFHPEALREWHKLAADIREMFKKKLAERLIQPRITASKLRGSSDRYKIKLRAAGFRLVTEVRDQQLLVLAVAMGKRDRQAVYRQAVRDLLPQLQALRDSLPHQTASGVETMLTLRDDVGS
jgi:mRNA interferase RelE/StbE